MFDNVWFKSITPHMKCFADDLAASWADSDNYVLKKASEERRDIFDQSVYSSMRNWRMPFQSKFGSDRVLLPVGNDGTWRQWLVSDIWDTARGVIAYPVRLVNVVQVTTGKRKGTRKSTKATGKGPQTSAYQCLRDTTWPEPLEEKIKKLDVRSLMGAFIPSKTMDRDLYLCLCFACQNCGVTFPQWAEKHSKRWSASKNGWEEMTKSRWRGLNVYNGHKLGKHFLIKAAIASGNLTEALVADYYVQEAWAFRPPEGLTRRVDIRYISNEELGQEKCQAFCSATGTGKTTLIGKVCAEYADERILYVVPSVPLSYSVRDDMNRKHPTLNFKHYLSTNKSLHNIKQLVSSCQSLWRGDDKQAKPYKLVVLDEIESILGAILGPTSHHHIRGLKQLEWVVANAHKVIVADACMTDNTTEWTQHCFKRDILYTLNTWKPENRICYMVPTPLYGETVNKCKKTLDKLAFVKDLRADDEAEAKLLAKWMPVLRKAEKTLRDGRRWYDILINEIEAKRRTFICLNSVPLGMDIQKNVFKASMAERAFRCSWTDHIPDDMKRLILSFVNEPDETPIKYDFIYRGSDHSPETFSNPYINGEGHYANKGWTQVDQLVISPTIKEGLDFTRPHFHTCMVYAGLKCCVSPHMFIQMAGRLRSWATKYPRMYFSYNPRTAGLKHFHCIGIDAVEEHTAMASHFADELALLYAKHSDGFSFGDQLDPIYRSITCRLIAGKQCMLKYPKESFTYWIERAGWTVEDDNQETPPDQPDIFQQWELGLKPVRLADIKQITPETYGLRLKSRKLTRTDVDECSRFKFENVLFDIPETETDTQEFMWACYRERPRSVYNMISSRDNTVQDAMAQAWCGEYRSGTMVETWLDRRPIQQHAIEAIEHALGKKVHELRSATGLTMEFLKPATAFVDENIHRLSIVFQSHWKTPYQALKNILEQWGGFELSVEVNERKKEKKHTIDFPNALVKEPEWVAFVKEHPEFNLKKRKKWTIKDRHVTLKKLKQKYKNPAYTARDKRKKTYSLTCPRWDMLRTFDDI